MAPCDPTASPRAQRLLEALRRVGESETFLFGHQNTGWSNQAAQSRVVESDVTVATRGDFPSLVGFNLAQARNGRLLEAVEVAKRWGAVLTFSWEAPNPVSGGSAHDRSGGALRAILPGGSANDKWNAWVDEIAAFFLRVDAPILFRPFHENTADVYWWGVCASAADFKAAWRYTQERLWSRGVHDLLFVYSPSKPDRDYQQAFTYRYPGAAAVDVVAFDYYGANDISRGLLSCCAQAARFAAAEGKPLAIAEFGVYGGLGAGASDGWFVESFSRPVRSDPACKRIAYALTWANSVQPPSYYVPLPGQRAYESFLQLYSSGAALFAKRASPNVYSPPLEDMEETSPPPPPPPPPPPLTIGATAASLPVPSVTLDGLPAHVQLEWRGGHDASLASLEQLAVLLVAVCALACLVAIAALLVARLRGGGHPASCRAPMEWLHPKCTAARYTALHRSGRQAALAGGARLSREEHRVPTKCRRERR
ncbi:hypothetical protein AB1Y20_011821 [Prymnesium parvum]|uniref:GH26 domain-containing protein n=1 Tax=Prymnesium parvum TaxID=97485 RepID=A0AB34IKI1_PRYPA